MQDLSHVLGIPRANSLSNLQYNDKLCIFSKPNLKFNFDGYNKNAYKLDIFQQLHTILDKRIRYCPSCIIQGYHSVHHQLTFLDECLIHKEKLRYLCNCKETYLIQSFNHNKAYACPECRKSIEVPEIKEFIVNLWNKPVKPAKINHCNIENISIIDYFSYISRYKEIATCMLNKKGKKILKELYIKGSTKLINENYKENLKYNEYNNIQMSIYQYLTETYGIEKLTEQANFISLFFRTHFEKDKHNLEIISSIFLLRDILPVSTTYHLFNNQMGIKEDLKNEIVYPMKYINNILHFVNDENLKIYICIELMKERFNQIKRNIINNHHIPAADEYLKHENSYPIFIVVKELEGNYILYKCHSNNNR